MSEPDNPSRPPGISKSTWKLIQEAIQVTQTQIKRMGGERFISEIAQAAEVVAQYGPDVQKFSRLLRHFPIESIPEQWPGKSVGLERIRISGETSLISIAKQLDEHYGVLLSQMAPPVDIPELALTVTATLKIPTSVIEAVGSPAVDELIIVAESMRMAGAHLARSIIKDVDSAIWAGHMGAASEWSDYSLDFKGLLKDDDQFLPAGCLGSVPFQVAESEDESAQAHLERMAALGLELQQVASALLKSDLGGTDDCIDAEISLNAEDLSSHQVIHEREVKLRSNGIEIIARDRLFVPGPDRVQVTQDEDAELDRQFLLTDRKVGNKHVEKVVSTPVPTPPSEDPAISTNLVYHLGEDGCLWVKAYRGSTEYAKVEYCSGKNGCTKQAKLFLLLLGKFEEGLLLKEVLREIYADDIAGLSGGGIEAHRVIANVRSLMSDTAKRAVTAGFDKRIFPQSWGKKSHSVQLHLNVASVVCSSPKSSSPGNLTIYPLRENDQSI